MRFIRNIILLLIGLFILYLFIGWMVDGYGGGNIVPNSAVPDSWEAPRTWARWRDVVITLTGFFWLLAGLLLIGLFAALIALVLTLRRILRENVAPAIDSLRVSLDQAKGTAEFASETVVSPMIRVYSVVRGVRTGVGAVGNLPDFIRRRKSGGKRRK